MERDGAGHLPVAQPEPTGLTDRYVDPAGGSSIAEHHQPRPASLCVDRTQLDRLGFGAREVHRALHQNHRRGSESQRRPRGHTQVGAARQQQRFAYLEAAGSDLVRLLLLVESQVRVAGCDLGRGRVGQQPANRGRRVASCLEGVGALLVHQRRDPHHAIVHALRRGQRQLYASGLGQLAERCRG